MYGHKNEKKMGISKVCGRRVCVKKTRKKFRKQEGYIVRSPMRSGKNNFKINIPEDGWLDTMAAWRRVGETTTWNRLASPSPLLYFFGLYGREQEIVVESRSQTRGDVELLITRIGESMQV